MAMSWRPRRKTAQLSIHEFKGLADANPSLTQPPHLTELQLAAELEKRGWSVNKGKN